MACRARRNSDEISAGSSLQPDQGTTSGNCRRQPHRAHTNDLPAHLVRGNVHRRCCGLKRTLPQGRCLRRRRKDQRTAGQGRTQAQRRACGGSRCVRRALIRHRERHFLGRRCHRHGDRLSTRAAAIPQRRTRTGRRPANWCRTSAQVSPPPVSIHAWLQPLNIAQSWKQLHPQERDCHGADAA
jgi:hypothetical protein